MYRNGRHDAFIAHPKAASMAVATVLRNNGWRKTSNHHELDFPMPRNVISVIREPEDWYVSWYFYLNRCENRPTFEEWFKTAKEDPFVAGGFFGLQHTTHLVFLDRLQAGFDAVFQDIGLPRLIFPVFHATYGRNGATPDEIFTNSTRNLLDKGEIARYTSLRERLGDDPYLRLK